MKTYGKRIAFCISDQHLVPHGGIGQFAKGFTEMAKDLNWKVDLILDKASSNDFGALVESLGANIITRMYLCLIRIIPAHLHLLILLILKRCSILEML